VGRIALYIAAIVLVLALLMTAAHAAISEASAQQHTVYLPIVERAYPTAISGVGPVTPTPTP